MNRFMILLVVLSVFAIIEFFGFRAVRTLTENLSETLKNTAKGLYIGSFVSFFLMLFSIFIFRDKLIDYKPFNYMLFAGGFGLGVFAPKIVLAVFQILQDITQLIALLIKTLTKSSTGINGTANTISRSDFLLKVGVVIAALPFFGLLFGIFRGRFNFDLKKVPLAFSHLPTNFEGLKIAQISDLHLGNFANSPEKLQEAVDIINEQKCDLVFITGDLVNIKASELDDYIPTLNNIKSKYGNYAILGNHDYGEYYNWDTKVEEKENLQRLKDNYPKTGFRLLLNESDTIQVGGDKIAVIGIENWGHKPFPQYGDLTKAMKGVESVDFKLLLSHDPTFWDEQVAGKNDIALTMSGHTHGMQFAFKLPWTKFQWSPVQFKYPKWSGIYGGADQKLYVNVGLGVVGYPGRVGALPEITLFELSKG